MNNKPTEELFEPKIIREIRKSLYDLELTPPPCPDQETDKCYKEKLENEIKEWTEILQKKYLINKNPPPQFKLSNTDETNLKLTDEQEIYLSQAPDFQQMIADHKDFVKTIEYYLNLRTHVVEDIEYRHNLLNSITNKAIRDIINKAIYE